MSASVVTDVRRMTDVSGNPLRALSGPAYGHYLSRQRLDLRRFSSDVWGCGRLLGFSPPS